MGLEGQVRQIITENPDIQRILQQDRSGKLQDVLTSFYEETRKGYGDLVAFSGAIDTFDPVTGLAYEGLELAERGISGLERKMRRTGKTISDVSGKLINLQDKLAMRQMYFSPFFLPQALGYKWGKGIRDKALDYIKKNYLMPAADKMFDVTGGVKRGASGLKNKIGRTEMWSKLAFSAYYVMRTGDWGAIPGFLFYELAANFLPFGKVLNFQRTYLNRVNKYIRRKTKQKFLDYLRTVETQAKDPNDKSAMGPGALEEKLAA